MSGRKKFIKNLMPCLTYTIGLPNGKRARGIQIVFVSLSPNFNIDNVLYIPKHHCNLISISQLSKENKCVVIFNDNVLMLQDRTSELPIRVGEERDGIYNILPMPTISSFACFAPNSS